MGRHRFRNTRNCVTRDVVKQRIERCKTEASKKPVPIDAALAEALWSWRLRCSYNQPEDWVFASPHAKGKQPYWPSSLHRVYLKPALKAVGITEPVGWHTLRHTFGTLMKANGGRKDDSGTSPPCQFQSHDGRLHAGGHERKTDGSQPGCTANYGWRGR